MFYYYVLLFGLITMFNALSIMFHQSITIFYSLFAAEIDYEDLLLLFTIISVFIFLWRIIMFRRNRRRPPNNDFWVLIFDTRNYINPRLHYPTDVLGYTLQFKNKNLRRLEEYPARRRARILSLPFVKQFLRETRKKQIWFGRSFGGSLYLVLDSRDNPTTLTEREYVQVYHVDPALRKEFPTMKYEFVKKRLAPRMTRRTEFEVLLKNLCSSSSSFSSSGDPDYRTLLEYLKAARDINYTFCDFFHMDRPFFLSLMDKLITRYGTKLFVVGPPGCGKTTIATRLAECYGFKRCPASNDHPGGVLIPTSGKFIIDEFDKLCAKMLYELTHVKDIAEAYRESETVKDSINVIERAEYSYSTKREKAANFLTTLFAAPNNALLIANSLEPVQKLIRTLFGEPNSNCIVCKFEEAFFRPGRYCPYEITTETVTSEYIKEYCAFYMSTLSPSQVHDICHVMRSGKYPATASLLYDMAQALGYETTYFDSFPAKIDFEYKPTGELFSRVLKQFVKEEEDD